MRVRQYAYFSIHSDDVPPDAISDIVGRPPTDSSEKGSRNGFIPTRHLWSVRSGVTDSQPLNDHWEALLPQLEPYAERIASGVHAGHFGVEFRVWREMQPGAEDRSIIEPGNEGEDWVRMGGQHPLLGFNLGVRLVRFAAIVGCDFDFDEYGDEET